MKKLLPLLGLLLLAACSTTNLPAPSWYSAILDYSALTQKGIFVTESNSVSFDYVAVGSIYISEKGGWIKKEKTKKQEVVSNEKKNDDYYYSAKSLPTESISKMKYASPDINLALEHLAISLEESGANGIINLKVSYTPNEIIVSGMAIKR